jgi:hypothetical protein
MRKQLIPYAAGLTAACLLSLPGGALAAPTFVFDAVGFNKLDTGGLATAAAALGVDISAFGGATFINGTTFEFPIIGGAADVETVIFESVSVGGFKLVKGSKVVTFNSPIVNTTETQPIMTFLITINGNLQGRYDLFDLTVPAYVKSQPLKSGSKVHASGITVALSQTGAAILNAAFDTTAFTAGPRVGTLMVKSVLGQKIPG